MSAQDAARQTDIKVAIAGVDITDEIKKNLISLTYTDSEAGEADDLQIKLEDSAGKWLRGWLTDMIDAAAQGKGSGSADTTKTKDTRAGIRDIISLGSVGFDTGICQAYLKALGYELKVDGKAGKATVDAIKKFQSDNKLSRTGECNRGTWKRLTEAVSHKTLPRYVFTFKADSPVALRESAGNSAKKLETIRSGQTCVITDKVASGWYAVTFGSIKGVALGTNLKIHNVSTSEDHKAAGKVKGLRIYATITRKNWHGDGTDQSLECGLYELDSISASGPPASITIKGTSLTYNRGFRTTRRSRAWEAVKLSLIAKRISGANGLAFMFDSGSDPYYKRIEQSNETDIAFIQRLCKNAGLNLKAANNMIVIYEQERYERQIAIRTITFGDGSYTKYDLDTSEGDVHYAVCRVAYTNPATGKKIEGYAYAEDYEKDNEDNQTLNITDQKVTSISEATNLAEKLLRLHNKYERKAKFTFPGDPVLLASLTMVLKGWGAWDGKYMIERARHQVGGSGYTTQIELRRTLKQ